MIRAHFDAVRALIPADLTVYDGKVPADPAYPYTVLRAMSRPTALNLADQHNVFDGTLYVSHVGVSADSVQIVQERVRAALVDARPVVAGRSPWKLTIWSSGAMREDSDVTIPSTNSHPVVVVDQYRVASVPSAA